MAFIIFKKLWVLEYFHCISSKQPIALSPFPPASHSSSRQPLSHFLSLWLPILDISFKGKHTNIGICVWLSYNMIFPGLTYITASVDTSQYFIQLSSQIISPLYEYSTFCLCVHQLMDRNLGCFHLWLLLLTLLWTSRYEFWLFLNFI
jgi:hypothetical protein